MNVLRKHRKSNKKIKIKKYVLFIFSLIMTTFAWLTYTKVLNTHLNIHVAAWDMEYYIGDEKKENPIGIDISALYPQMPEQVIKIDIKNNGEALVDLDYRVEAISIAGVSYELVREGEQNTTENYINIADPTLEANEETGEKAEKQVHFFEEMSRKYKMLTVFGYTEPVPEERLKEHPDWNHYYNRLGIAENGELKLNYAKIHPFSYGFEGDYYQGGRKLKSVEWKDTTLGAFICYDLRFPEIFQISSEKSEIIFVIANWPRSRIDQWDTLLKARAIENQVYMVGVNRTGDGDGLHYNGHSAIYSPDGEVITTIREEECLLIGDINPGVIKEMRKTFPMKNDRREELYIKMWKNSML